METVAKSNSASIDKLENLLNKSYVELLKTKQENEFLRHELANIKRMIFGQKSERFIDTSENQLVLDGVLTSNNTIDEIQSTIETTTTSKNTKKKVHSRQPLPDNLPRIEQIIEPSDEDKICNICNKDKTVIGEDITEELEYIPPKFVVNKFIRKKYACSTCKDTITVGELPERPIKKGRPSSSLVTHVIVSKFVDHLPFYRQEEIFKRNGLFINRSTMSDWTREFCKLFGTIYVAMCNMVTESPYIQADETHIQVQDRKLKGKTHKGYLWSFLGNKKIVVFDYQKSRGRNGPLQFLAGFDGYLQTDAYASYNEHVRRSETIRLCCWAHVRRKFFDAKESDSICIIFIKHIKKLYEVEAYAKEQNLSNSEIVSLRKEKSAPILQEIKDLLDNPKKVILPSSPVGKAIAYAQNIWKELNVYLEDGFLEIDNNACERTIRSIAIGRKNWMFAGSHDGAERAAIIYSLVGTCKLNAIDPFEYIKDVFLQINDCKNTDIRKLTPLEWKNNRENTSLS